MSVVDLPSVLRPALWFVVIGAWLGWALSSAPDLGAAAVTPALRAAGGVGPLACLGLGGALATALGAFFLNRREAARARAGLLGLHQATLDGISQPLAVLDPDQGTATLNAPWMASEATVMQVAFRDGQWEVIGVGVSPRDCEAIARAIAALGSGDDEACEVEVRCANPDGKRWIVVEGRRLVVDGQPRVVLRQADVTPLRLAEQARRAAEARFDAVFQRSPVGMFVADMEAGCVLEVNDAFERMTGLRRAELVTTSDGVVQVFPKDQVAAMGSRLLAQGRIEGCEGKLRTRTRGTVPVRLFGTAVEAVGDPCVLTVMEDAPAHVEAMRWLTASEEMFRSLVQRAAGAVYRRVLDEDGTFRFLSDGVEDLTGHRAAAFMGPEALPLAGIIHAEDRDNVLPAIRAAIRAGQPYSLEYRIHHADGTVRWLDDRGHAAPADDQCVDGILMDVTAAKLDQAALMEAREAADAANRAKSAFLANMSHELRTPLNAVMGYAQILRRDPTLKPNQTQAMETIQHSCDHLLLLINDILDLAKIEAGRFELIPTACHPAGFFTTLVQMFRIRAEQKGISFEYCARTPLPRRVSVDEKRLRQVVMNLLGNAVKFTELGGVVLETGYEQGRLVVSVVDTGVGIPPNRLAQVFQPFHQFASDRYRSQGTGLGLAISRQLVQAMGGEISVVSRLGHGSRFTLAIPLEEEVACPSITLATLPAIPKVLGYRRTDGQSGPFRILVVDDSADNRIVLGEMLGPYGFEIAEAETGEDGVAQALEWGPDFVFMDVVLPGISGHEATERIHRQCPSAPPVIVALSASAFTEDIEASLNSGCCLHLTKPVRLDVVLRALEDNLPLEWIPVEEAAEPPAPALDGRPLDEGALRQLTGLYQKGDVILLRKEVERHLDLHPRHPVLCSLLDAARRFDMPALRRLLTSQPG